MVNTRKRKRENETPENEIKLTIPKKKSKKKEPSIIYFIVLCHGEVNFTKNIINNKYDPIYVNIPEKISLFNKITFAPLGIYNMMNDDQDPKRIFKKLEEELPKLKTEEIYGDLLVNKLKNKYSNLLDPAEDLKIETNPQSRGYFHILNNNKDQYYQNVTYNNTNKNNIPIIQKLFTLDQKVDKYGFNDIMVGFQMGGLLKTGDSILSNNSIFKNYMVKLYEKKMTNNIDKDDNYIYIPEITTDELLEIAVEYGYEKVVMIDYSCDFCRNIVDTNAETRIPRDIIRKWREEVKNNKFGRGGKKRKTVKFLKKLK